MTYATSVFIFEVTVSTVPVGFGMSAELTNLDWLSTINTFKMEVRVVSSKYVRVSDGNIKKEPHQVKVLLTTNNLHKLVSHLQRILLVLLLK